MNGFRVIPYKLTPFGKFIPILGHSAVDGFKQLQHVLHVIMGLRVINQLKMHPVATVSLSRITGSHPYLIVRTSFLT
jgi:hypothetical protein